MRNRVQPPHHAKMRTVHFLSPVNHMSGRGQLHEKVAPASKLLSATVLTSVSVQPSFQVDAR